MRRLRGKHACVTYAAIQLISVRGILCGCPFLERRYSLKSRLDLHPAMRRLVKITSTVIPFTWSCLWSSAHEIHIEQPVQLEDGKKERSPQSILHVPLSAPRSRHRSVGAHSSTPFQRIEHQQRNQKQTSDFPYGRVPLLQQHLPKACVDKWEGGDSHTSVHRRELQR
jgi:hypothetical protein